MKKAFNFLSDDGRQIVAKAVATAEKATSGEIVVLVVSSSKRFWHLFKTKSQAVNRRAEKEFLKLGIQQTEGRTGVLIMVSVKEHMVVIKADRDINLKVPQSTWDDIVRLIIDDIKGGNPCLGLCSGVGKVAYVLAQHFPAKPDDVNELPNDVVQKE